jgi:DNA (cytosine-5)-methyltransferase 1
LRSDTEQGVPRTGVRRLTPLECERLQGFPDGHTDIPGNSDTQRYRQLGNAVAVPVAEWIMRRL